MGLPVDLKLLIALKELASEVLNSVFFHNLEFYNLENVCSY